MDESSEGRFPPGRFCGKTKGDRLLETVTPRPVPRVGTADSGDRGGRPPPHRGSGVPVNHLYSRERRVSGVPVGYLLRVDTDESLASIFSVNPFAKRRDPTSDLTLPLPLPSRECGNGRL